jgi:hypothetical protein
VYTDATSLQPIPTEFRDWNTLAYQMLFVNLRHFIELRKASRMRGSHKFCTSQSFAHTG